MNDSEDSALELTLDHIYGILEIGEMFAAVLTTEEQSLLLQSGDPTVEEMYLDVIRAILNT